MIGHLHVVISSHGLLGYVSRRFGYITLRFLTKSIVSDYKRECFPCYISVITFVISDFAIVSNDAARDGGRSRVVGGGGSSCTR